MENKPNPGKPQQQPGKQGGMDEKRQIPPQDPSKQGESWRQGQGGSNPDPNRKPQMPTNPARSGGGQQW
ncbi:MAG TPA: hypothetical protein VKE49_08580 [Myxococcaceae bacterium]|nr:hypothetical protein [Myxococcaceae bacterium]